DMSGSMCQPCSKIEAAIKAANTMVDTLYNDPNPKTVLINSTNYDLLNIGMVPWNSKVNVRTNEEVPGALANTGTLTVTPETVTPSFDNPFAAAGAPKQSVVYKTNASHVRFLFPPDSDWKGGVYARYLGDDIQTNDADMTLGYVTVGNKDWHA